MMKMREKADDKKKLNINRGLLIRSLISMAVVVVLLVAATYAWFTDKTNITTLVDVKGPTAIAILGPHGQAQASLDMSYTDDDVTTNADGSKTVTIHRVVSVSSGAAHQLELAHTTNLKGLSFKIYRAEEVGSGQGKTMITPGTVDAGTYTYRYDISAPLEGAYINQEKETDGYRYANSDLHEQNFDEYSNVQSHAEPLYWMAKKVQESDSKPSDITNLDNAYLTYYVIEISWTETTKETDLFYLLAKNR